MTYTAAYVHKRACQDPEIAIALRWLLDRQSEAGELLVFAPGTRNVESSPLLMRHRRSLTIATPLTLRRSVQWSSGPALALWPTADMLATLDDHNGVTALAAVPWLLEDLDVWIASRRPIDLLGVTTAAAGPQIDDPVVRVALEHLTHSVNLSSGLTHPSDKASAVHTFKLLLKAGHRWDPEVVHAWALAHDWRNKGAADLRRYAAGILEGKTFQTKGNPYRSETVQIWEEEAESG